MVNHQELKQINSQASGFKQQTVGFQLHKHGIHWQTLKAKSNSKGLNPQVDLTIAMCSKYD